MGIFKKKDSLLEDDVEVSGEVSAPVTPMEKPKDTGRDWLSELLATKQTPVPAANPLLPQGKKQFLSNGLMGDDGSFAKLFNGTQSIPKIAAINAPAPPRRKALAPEPTLAPQFGEPSGVMEVKESARTIADIAGKGGFQPTPPSDWQRMSVGQRWTPWEKPQGLPTLGADQAARVKGYAPQVFETERGKQLAAEAAGIDPHDPRMAEVMQKYYNMVYGGNWKEPEQFKGLMDSGKGI